MARNGYVKEAPGFNNRLIRAIAATGHRSYKDFAAHHGLDQVRLQRLVRNDALPVGPNRDMAEQLMIIFGKMFNELFDDQYIYDEEEGLTDPQVAAMERFTHARRESREELLPEEAYDTVLLQKVVTDLLDTETGLIPSEALVLQQRFGLYSNELTMREIGEQFGVSHSRISQIEAKALRKLRHPTRHALLVQFLDPEWYQPPLTLSEEAAKEAALEEAIVKEAARREFAARPVDGGERRGKLELTLEEAYLGGEREMRIWDGWSPREKVTVNVPVGVKDEEEIRVEGHGLPGLRGGKTGPLILEVKYKKHLVFTPRGLDLHCESLVIFYRLEKYKVIDVPSLGDPVRVKIERHTQNGQRYRLRGKGMYDPKTDTYGDLIFRVVIQHAHPHCPAPTGPEVAIHQRG